MICPICDQGEGISGEEAPPFTFTTATGSSMIFGVGTATCLDAEFVSNYMPDLVDTNGCNHIRDQISDVCCVKDSSETSTSAANVPFIVESIIIGAASIVYYWM